MEEQGQDLPENWIQISHVIQMFSIIIYESQPLYDIKFGHII